MSPPRCWHKRKSPTWVRFQNHPPHRSFRLARRRASARRRALHRRALGRAASRAACGTRWQFPYFLRISSPYPYCAGTARAAPASFPVGGSCKRPSARRTTLGLYVAERVERWVPRVRVSRTLPWPWLAPAPARSRRRSRRASLWLGTFSPSPVRRRSRSRAQARARSSPRRRQRRTARLRRKP